MSRKIGVVDYGSGNLQSMLNALRAAASVGDEVVSVADGGSLRGLDRIVLPGVGAFAECRRLLEARGLLGALAQAVASGCPLLGVCVGMQLLADEGREHGATAGLGWVGGIVRRLEPGPKLKVPHVGWRPLVSPSGPLFEGTGPRDRFYFVHSYVLDCSEPGDCCAWSEHGEKFTAAVRRGHIFGTQFHPEKSDRSGLRVLANFCRWTP